MRLTFSTAGHPDVTVDRPGVAERPGVADLVYSVPVDPPGWAEGGHWIEGGLLTLVCARPAWWEYHQVPDDVAAYLWEKAAIAPLLRPRLASTDWADAWEPVLAAWLRQIEAMHTTRTNWGVVAAVAIASLAATVGILTAVMM